MRIISIRIRSTDIGSKHNLNGTIIAYDGNKSVCYSFLGGFMCIIRYFSFNKTELKYQHKSMYIQVSRILFTIQQIFALYTNPQGLFVGIINQINQHVENYFDC